MLEIFRLICAHEGKSVYKEIDVKKRDRDEASGQSLAEPDVHPEQVVTFNVGPFNNIGRGIIEASSFD